MLLTPRVLSIIQAVAHYGVLTASQIRSICFPNVQSDGSNIRSRLRDMVSAKLLSRTHMQVVNPTGSLSAPVYYSSPLGLETLTCQTGDERYAGVSTKAPPWQNLAHQVSIADLHILADRSVALQQYAVMERWVNEFDIVNGEATNPAERFSLYTLIRERPKLVCVPDAAFVLSVLGFRKAFYLELERGTNPTQRAAAEKTPGYAALRQQLLHKKHFPGVLDDFTVLVTAPDARWRDALKKAFACKDGATLFKFAAMTELTPETFLFGPVWHPCTGEATAIIKQPATQSSPASGQPLPPPAATPTPGEGSGIPGGSRK